MVAVTLIGLKRGSHAVVPEAVLLWCFLAWAVSTGWVMALSTDLLLVGAERLFQVAVVVFCVAGVSARLRSPALGLGACLVVAVMLAVYGMVSGDFGSIGEMSEKGGMVVGVRARSMVGNANTLGVGAVWGVAAVTYFAPMARRRLLRIVLWSSVPLLCVSMIASASRKALVLPVVYLVAWIWFCHRKWLLRRWQSGAAVAAVAAILLWVYPWVLENTYAGYRFQSTIEPGVGFFERDVRFQLYRVGVKLVAEHPIAGVGLYQFPFYDSVWRHASLHSDYLEVAATTGLVGLALYLAPYVLTVRRVRRVWKFAGTEAERYRAGVSLAVLVTVAAAGFGQVLFSSLAYWALMAALWGYAFGAERALGGLRVQGQVHVAIKQRNFSVAGLHRQQYPGVTGDTGEPEVHAP